jgi:hypothetical protein
MIDVLFRKTEALIIKDRFINCKYANDKIFWPLR